MLAPLFRMRSDQRARTMGLTRPVWRTIPAVHFAEAATQGEIVEILDVESVMVARTVDRRDAAGLIET
jgi:DNA-binding MarR family transcriptional regulator